MIVRSRVPLAPLTTLGVGGAADFYIECATSDELLEARAFAQEKQLPLRILGGGSNVLVPDNGVSAVVAHLTANGVSQEGDGDTIDLRADAGASWDEVVRAATTRGLWGIENLAGIPGSVGAAPVQNIGAYGVELASVVHEIDVLDLATGAPRTLTRDDAQFAYRDSVFKKNRHLAVLAVSLALTRSPRPQLAYKDLVLAQQSGVPLGTPAEIAEAVRAIRAKKFPDLAKEGTAGSFFKNPIISAELASELATRYPELPCFPQADGRVKIALAYILDKVLGLRGFVSGHARLYEAQPLVIVVQKGAPALEVEALAHEVTRRVLDATGIEIEREVETFLARA